MHVKTRAEWEDEREELLEGLREFASVMKRAPLRNRGGLRGVSAFALWWFVRRADPEVVFESGIWKGFSTWLIEQAAPRAELFCFDPVIFLRRYVWGMGRTYRSKRAHYSGQDFSCAPIVEMTAGRTNVLAFFDDHQNKWPRLEQCRRFGITDMVFDDNYRNPTHRSLEEEPRSLLETEIAEYEVFPALWPVDFEYGGTHILHEGMGFPVDRALTAMYRERKWHSSVTYVKLRAR
ncbi:MAG TPA: hypothetical protein VND45_12120 [Thermoanaerobaculia bacterium]|nr:hypothetical protein [Thermoanaerobaculia bacterium]